MLTVCRFTPKSAAWAVHFTNAIRKSDGIGDLHMEGKIDRLKTKKRRGWTSRHFGGVFEVFKLSS